MEKTTLRKADLVISISFVFIQYIKLFFNPFGRNFEDINAGEMKAALMDWTQSPVLLPMLLSGFLLICALLLMHFALRQGACLDFCIGKINHELLQGCRREQICIEAIVETRNKKTGEMLVA